MQKTTSRRWLTIVAVVLSVLAIAAPAFAHYVYQTTTYSRYGSRCYWGRSEISHGSKSPYGGYWKSTSWANDDVVQLGVTIHCSQSLQLPAGYLAAAVLKLVWVPSGAPGQYAWAWCGSNSAWKYNTINKGSVDQIFDYGGKAPPCGPGFYYENWATVTGKDPTGAFWVKINGAYFMLESGAHWLPA